MRIRDRELCKQSDSEQWGWFDKAAKGELSADDLLEELDDDSLAQRFAQLRRQEARRENAKSKNGEPSWSDSEFANFRNESSRVAHDLRKRGAVALHESAWEAARQWVCEHAGLAEKQFGDWWRNVWQGRLTDRGVAKISRRVSRLSAELLLSELIREWPDLANHGEVQDLLERLKQENSDPDYQPGAWFTQKTKVKLTTLRKAASPERKTKRVRSDVKDGVKRYSASDARRWWPHDMEKA